MLSTKNPVFWSATYRHVCIKKLETTQPAFNVASRNASTLPSDAISQNISFHSASKNDSSNAERPMVLLYEWLEAKSKHILKYRDFYSDRGFDVVNVKIHPIQVLRPSKAKIVAEDVLNFVSRPEHFSKPLLYHGFSVGGYLYGETLTKINQDASCAYHQGVGVCYSMGVCYNLSGIYKKKVGGRLKGQIFDSPVDFAGIPHAFPNAVTDRKSAQKMMKLFIEGYLKLFYNFTTKHYLQASIEFKENKLNIPSLYMYSSNDKMANHVTIDETIQQFVDNGVDVSAENFMDSYHVGHFHKHPMRYKSAVDKFLLHIGLSVSNRHNCRKELEI